MSPRWRASPEGWKRRPCLLMDLDNGRGRHGESRMMGWADVGGRFGGKHRRDGGMFGAAAGDRKLTEYGVQIHMTVSHIPNSTVPALP